MTTNDEGDNAADLDETKLTGDEAEAYVFQWLSSTETDLKNGTSSTFKTSHTIYETKLLKVIAGQSPYPVPGRPFRQLAARCLVHLYTRGESRTLYDTLQTLLRSVSEVKSANSEVEFRKIAAMYCIGELMGSLGGQVMSLIGEVASIALKQFRYSSNSVLFRYHALTALKKGLTTAGRALTDSVMKDVIKQTRNALNDKAMSIQRAAADTLIILYPSGDGTRSVQDVESIVSSSLKSIEQADSETRRVLARLVGHILASTQTPRIIPPPPAKTVKSNKSSKPEGENEAEDEPSAIASEQAAQPIMRTPAMLCVLLNAVNKSNVTLNMRIGVFECYGALFNALGAGFVEREYRAIVRHFLIDMISLSSSPSEKAMKEKEAASVLNLKLVDSILNDLIGVRMLSEQGQVDAILEISSSYLKKWPALLSTSSTTSSKNAFSSRYEPEPIVLASALRLTSGLLSQLGAAPPSVQEALSRPLQTLLEHPLKEVGVCAAYALRIYYYNAPRGIARAVSSVLEGLQRDVNGLSVFQDGFNSAGGSNMPSEKELTSRALGHAYGLSALFSIIPLRPLYVSSDLSSRVFDTATQLLRTAGDHDIRRAAVEVECAWIALASLMCLGPGFVRTQVTSLMVLWRNALPKPTSKDLNSTSTSYQSRGTGPGTVTTSDRNVSEWSFMLHVRACALGAVLEFLRWNGWKLATRDVQRRLVGLLGNALAFANAFISSHSSPLPPGGVETENDFQLAFEREATLRKRVYECFSELASGFTSSTGTTTGTVGGGILPLPESTQLGLLQSTAAIFVGGYSELEKGTSALQAAIASVNTNFSTLWSGHRAGGLGSNGESWGLTSLVGFEEDGAKEEGEEGDVGYLVTQPLLGSPEHDPLLLCESPISSSSSSRFSSLPSSLFPSDSRNAHGSRSGATWSLPQPPSAQTSVVDASITLFSLLLPGQEKKECLKALSEVVDAARAISVNSPFSSSPSASGNANPGANGPGVGMGKERNAGRRAAVLVNAVSAIVGTLRVATAGPTSGLDKREGGMDLRETIGGKEVSERIASFLKETLLSTDPVLRRLSAEALGRLASLSDTSFLTSLVKWLVDSVVSNRDPYARSGCARAFGAVYTHVGGLALGALLKTTVNVLMSLANDPHPVVHYHSLLALGEVVQSASLAYAGYVKGTLSTLVRLYAAETHDPEGGTLANVNLKSSWRVQRVICRVIDALVAVLGPDIQEEERTRTRTLIIGLVHELGREDDEGVIVEAIKCMQHLLMFTASGQVDIDDLLLKLRSHLTSPRRLLRTVAINTLYQLVQRDALGLARAKSGGDALVEELFGMLDGAGAGSDKIESEDGAGEGGVKEVIKAWMEKTGEMNPVAWIGLCQRIMTRSGSEKQASSKAQSGALADDEGQSLSTGLDSSAGGEGGDAGGANGGLSARWRTQLFALHCLHRICTIVVQSGRREHLDIPYARALNASLVAKGGQAIREKELLVSHVADLIKMAFTASAAYVTEIRLEGLVLLKDVIEVFARSPDSDYDDALLLEQYQAPITAALTPAFSAETTPEILASAVKVCAVFVGSGVVKDVGRMGRILKLLTSALEQSKGSGMLSLGEAGELSPNASVMLRVATIAAWAELEVASTEQIYLQDVVKPYKETLGALWVSALRDYASIKGDNEVNQDNSGGVEESYMNLGREVLLPYYEKTWSVMLHAISTSMKANDPYIIAAMDGLETISTVSDLRSDREEPTALFFALFGLIYEALALSSADSTPSPTLRSNASIALEALESLVRPEYSGKALLDEPIFEEFRGMCVRIAMTEGAVMCTKLVRVIQAFVESQQKNLIGTKQSPVGGLSSGPLSQCLRICAYVLRKSIAGSGGMRSLSSDGYTDRIGLIRVAFEAFMRIGEVFGPSMKEDIRAVAVSLYAELLKEEKEDIDLAGPTLPSLKAILDNPPPPGDKDSLNRYSRLIHGLLSACLVNIDEMRGRQGAISTMKTMNNLLAAVLILTVVPPYVGFSEEALEYCCSLISQKLLEKQVSMTAAHCTKTIVIAGASGNQMLKFCIRLLLPGTIEYIAFVASLVGDPAKQEEQVKAVDEILKAFSAFFSSTPDEYRARTLGVLLPTLALLLDSTPVPTSVQQTQVPARSAHKLAVMQVLAFASLAPGAFKEATGKIEAAAKEKIELSVRQELEGKNRNSTTGSAKPQISLRSF